jgi:hypothetical protein
LHSIDVVAVDRPILFYANQLPGADFEDNVQIACTVKAKLEAIVTRDKSDFKMATVPVFSPGEFLAILEQQQEK